MKDMTEPPAFRECPDALGDVRLTRRRASAAAEVIPYPPQSVPVRPPEPERSAALPAAGPQPEMAPETWPCGLFPDWPAAGEPSAAARPALPARACPDTLPRRNFP